MASATATVARESSEYRVRSTFLQSILYLILALGAVVAIFPFAWMFLTSFKTYGEHSQKVFWPVGLTTRPFANRPSAQEIVVPMHPAERWQGATASSAP